ncbi:MAG TPA: TIGR03435 family protein [Acidobacteriaceae bacterium]|jgi:uncharacterized protein (TIGR03435 family)
MLMKMAAQRRTNRTVTLGILLVVGVLFAKVSLAQETFDVAVIRPSAAEVKFEHNGKTEFAHGTLTMRDVTVSTCIQLAYEVPPSLIAGPSSLKDVHYDITAKAAPDATRQQMRMMLRTLLHDRFQLAFHLEKKELKVYAMVVAKGGIKMKPSAEDGEGYHENSDIGMIGRSMTMHDLATYLSDPLGAPLTDSTGLPGRYDLKIDFRPYVDDERRDVRPDPVAVLKAALKGELGLELVERKDVMDVMTVDRVEPPSSN